MLYNLFTYDIDNTIIIFCINIYDVISNNKYVYKGQKYLLNILFNLYTFFTLDLYIADTSIHNKL